VTIVLVLSLVNKPVLRIMYDSRSGVAPEVGQAPALGRRGRWAAGSGPSRSGQDQVAKRHPGAHWRAVLRPSMLRSEEPWREM